MLVQQKQEARIYLNESRGIHELPWFRSFHTFSFGNYQDDTRKPLDSLYVLNDDTLAAGRSFELQVEKDTRVLLLPVTGSVSCNDSVVSPGQLLVLDIQAGHTIRIRNPYEEPDQLVNFIQYWFSVPQGIPALSQSVIPFDPGAIDRLTTVASSPRVTIGKYMGRSEDIYRVHDTACTTYVFIIEGAFEVENRLLHARDGLALKNFDTVEFEALSNQAIILLLEIPF